MRYEVVPIQVDYTKAQYPVPVAEPVAPKQDDFQPTLTMYLHDDANVLEWSVVPRKAVVVIPGGAYRHVSEREGEPIASFLFAAGMQVFVLHYSTVPNVFPAALMELAESMRFVRSHAEEFHINPEKIAVMGFSAGGHLAANLATMYGDKFLLDSIGATEEEIKPNAQLLIYPVISSGDFAHRNSFKNLCGTMEELQQVLSLENLVTENTPPAFMVAAWNDPLVPVRNSLVYADALA